jgi:hypothetical protein
MKHIRLILLLAMLIGLCSCDGCDTRHKAKVFKLKNHHIAMVDDQGKWWEYVLKNADVDFDIPTSTSGEMKLPSGGSWRPATQQEEEEVTEETVQTEDTTVDETDAGTPDGAGDVGGDSGGADSGDGGDGGGDGGGGDD